LRKILKVKDLASEPIAKLLILKSKIRKIFNAKGLRAGVCLERLRWIVDFFAEMLCGGGLADWKKSPVSIVGLRGQ